MLHQGPNKLLKKFIPCFKKVWKSTKSRLDDDEINGIFTDVILLVLKYHAIYYDDLGFTTTKRPININMGIKI